MKLVLKIGGSLLFDEKGQFHLPRIQDFARIIRKIVQNGHELALVVGGGALARRLINHGKTLGGDRQAQDWLGITATRASAQLMITALQDIAYPVPILSEEQVPSFSKKTKLVVAGGFLPDQSTNAVAARIAELVDAQILINATDVDGVYNEDPKQFPHAQLLTVVTPTKLREVISSLSSEPGTYKLFDKRALDIVERAHVEVWFVNGQDPQNILQAIENQKIGTRLIPENHNR